MNVSNYCALAMCAGLALHGCGGSDGPPAGEGGKQTPQMQKGQAKAIGKDKKGELVFYKKVEDFAEPKEAKDLRIASQPKSFTADPTGLIIRDPFRSYVIASVASTNKTTEGNERPQCDIRRRHAPNPLAQDSKGQLAYSWQDLRLTGIVRGRRNVAIFQDSTGYTHIVYQGDCIGKEQARVREISVTRVRLELAADTTDTATAGATQVRDIPLDPALSLPVPDTGEAPLEDTEG